MGKTKKLISIVLILTMITSIFAVSAISTNAASSQAPTLRADLTYSRSTTSRICSGCETNSIPNHNVRLNIWVPSGVSKVRVYIGKDYKGKWCAYKDYNINSGSGNYYIDINARELHSSGWSRKGSSCVNENIHYFKERTYYYFQVFNMENNTHKAHSPVKNVCILSYWGKQ